MHVNLLISLLYSNLNVHLTQVKHFSKYGLVDEDEDDDDPAIFKLKLQQQQQQQLALLQQQQKLVQQQQEKDAAEQLRNKQVRCCYVCRRSFIFCLVIYAVIFLKHIW